MSKQSPKTEQPKTWRLWTSLGRRSLFQQVGKPGKPMGTGLLRVHAVNGRGLLGLLVICLLAVFAGVAFGEKPARMDDSTSTVNAGTTPFADVSSAIKKVTVAALSQGLLTLTNSNTNNFIYAPATASVSGRLTNGNGGGISGAVITLTITGTSTSFSSAATNSSGNYIINNLDIGANYTAGVTGGGFGCPRPYGQPDGVLTPLTGNVSGLNYVTTCPTSTASGNIIINGGGDLSGLTVTPVAPNSPFPSPTPCPGPYTGGNFNCTGLWFSTTYDIIPAKPNYTFTPAPVRISGNVSGIQYIGSPVTATVSGVITTGNGAGISGAAIVLTNTATSQTYTGATTNSSGNYTINNVPIGANYSASGSSGASSFNVQSYGQPESVISPLTGNVSGLNFAKSSPQYTAAGNITINGGGDLSGLTVTPVAPGSPFSSPTPCPGPYTAGHFDCIGLWVDTSYDIIPAKPNYVFTPAPIRVTDNIFSLQYTGNPLPTVATASATSIAQASATLNGSVNPNGIATSAWFEWGTDPTLTSNTLTPSQSKGSGTSSQALSQNLSGLVAGTTYYFRAVGMNNGGTVKGPILSFATTPNNISVTVQSNPAGRSFIVDGTTHTTAQTVSWTAGSLHTISTTSPQAGATGTQYVWSSWSDSGAISHSVTAPSSDITYTANFTTQFMLTMSAGTGGTVSPASGFFNSGQSVQISATSNSGFSFSGWTGSGSGSITSSTNPVNVTMNGPITETASFTPQIQVTVQTNPTGRTVSIDGGAAVTAPQVVQWTPGTSHTITTTSPQAGAAGTQYVWTSWSDSGAISHGVTAPSVDTTYTANFTTQFLLTMSAGSGGTVSPASGFINSGQSVQISATPNSGFSFSGWTGSGSGSFTGSTNPVNVTMNGPITEAASFTATPTIQLMLDSSGPEPDQAAALDSILFLRDPFPVINSENSINPGSDRNTRVMIFVTNLQLAQGDLPSAVSVDLIAGANPAINVPAEDVRPVPNSIFTQVIFKLPTGLLPGTYTIKVKLHNEVSNTGTIGIRL